MKNIISRRFSEKDKQELNDLYNLVAGRSRTIEHFEWEWLDTLEGWEIMWLLEDTKEGQIIGHHGLIPIRFSYFGRSILTRKTENTVMHPSYRGKGIYYPVEVKFLQQAKERFQLTWTVCGAAEQGRIPMKLGYSKLGGYASFMKFIKSSYLNEWLIRVIRKRIRNRFLVTLLIGPCKVGSGILMLLSSRRIQQTAQ